MLSFADARAVVARPCLVKSPMRCSLARAITSKSRGSLMPSVTNAHAVLARPCGAKSPMRCSLSRAITSKSCGSLMPSVANACTVVTRLCANARHITPVEARGEPLGVLQQRHQRRVFVAEEAGALATRRAHLAKPLPRGADFLCIEREPVLLVHAEHAAQGTGLREKPPGLARVFARLWRRASEAPRQEQPSRRTRSGRQPRAQAGQAPRRAAQRGEQRPHRAPRPPLCRAALPEGRHDGVLAPAHQTRAGERGTSGGCSARRKVRGTRTRPVRLDSEHDAVATRHAGPRVVGPGRPARAAARRRVPVGSAPGAGLC
ncbi:hypothetical protein T492DRAFT_255653 [Pavlovales sp. CCMP2436]|nr:hypothetical protein T492DRAFT_255653 [Pavlovales sp. CCMP2436]